MQAKWAPFGARFLGASESPEGFPPGLKRQSSASPFYSLISEDPSPRPGPLERIPHPGRRLRR